MVSLRSFLFNGCSVDRARDR